MVAKFDDFAVGYEEILNRSIRITGESPAYFAQYKARYIARHWPVITGRILDYGCGIGLLANLLKTYLPQAQVNGYDPSPASVQRVPQYLRGEGTFTSDLRSVGSSYDLIVVANVMHHIPPTEREDTISGLQGRLAKNGRIVVFEHNPLNPMTRWAVAHCDFDDDAILLWPREMARYLSGAGLRVHRDYIVFFPRMFNLLRRYEPLLHWCPFGAQYVTVGEYY